MTIMTGNPEVQWYLAREGRQHGPLSDVEMQKLVELNYLRPTDLVWRPGFANWLPAPSVFPPAAVAAQPPVPPRPTEPAPSEGDAKGQGEATAGKAAQMGTGSSRPSAAAQPRPTVPGASPAPASSAPMVAASGRSVRSGPLVPVDAEFDTEEQETVQKPARSAGRKAAIAAALLLVLGGGGYAALTLGKSGQPPGAGTKAAPPAATSSKPAPPAAPAPAAEQAKATAAPPADTRPAPLAALTEEPDQLDARLQRSPMWTVVKKEFPDWYGERLKEVAQLSGTQQPQGAIAKHLVEALVALRRKHADQALAASTGRLRTIASAFLANLRQLRDYHQNACYSFISQGETSPVVVEMMQKPEYADPIQAQVVAIFEAIAEGRRQPVQHTPPSKEDYNQLADQLTKLGWSQSDLQLFADPRALARTSPERVCKMVQDWFSAHIEIKDAAAQERLLVETLRPVVSG
jgi:hypothetical protein